MNAYTIEKAKKGSKTEVRILLNGEVIGKRTSARPYRFALLVKRSQPRALATAQSNLKFQTSQFEEYSAVAEDKPGARERFIKFNDQGHANTPAVQGWRKNWIENGEVAKWAEHSRSQIEKLEKYIAALSSGPQPEFDKVFVASWHQSRRNVPSCKEWHVFVDVVEIPE